MTLEFTYSGNTRTQGNYSTFVKVLKIERTCSFYMTVFSYVGGKTVKDEYSITIGSKIEDDRLDKNLTKEKWWEDTNPNWYDDPSLIKSIIRYTEGDSNNKFFIKQEGGEVSLCTCVSGIYSIKIEGAFWTSVIPVSSLFNNIQIVTFNEATDSMEQKL